MEREALKLALEALDSIEWHDGVWKLNPALDEIEWHDGGWGLNLDLIETAITAIKEVLKEKNT